jgi:hypothetical protein
MGGEMMMLPLPLLMEPEPEYGIPEMESVSVGI